MLLLPVACAKDGKQIELANKLAVADTVAPAVVVRKRMSGESGGWR